MERAWVVTLFPPINILLSMYLFTPRSIDFHKYLFAPESLLALEDLFFPPKIIGSRWRMATVHSRAFFSTIRRTPQHGLWFCLRQSASPTLFP
jgi:hypothetical protein